MLEIKTSYYSNILNIELYGALDSLTAPDFKHWLTEKSKSGYYFFSLNCGGLEFISSRGISILTELNNILNTKNHRLILYHVSNEVLNLLEFLKLSDTIPIVDTFEHAREVFSKNPVPQPETFNGAKRKEESADSKVTGIPAQKEAEKTALDEAPTVNPSAENRPEEESIETEYIDLNSDKHLKHGDDISVINVVFCPNCGENLKVSKKGLYLCPECRTKFNYPFQ